ncbi:MAG: hypothetical protein LBR10_07070 [Prevotellaceae bacterium]|jgi:hypothetical protein|nr:hypothetical protein [Prevotellaceae bacterium]
MPKKNSALKTDTPQPISADVLYKLSLLIEKSKQKAVSEIGGAVNMLFWYAGNRINDEQQGNAKAAYGVKP